MFDPTEYNITIRKVIIEGESVFEATIKELPDVAEYADSYSEAYELAIDTIETAAAMFAQAGKPFPSPYKQEQDYCATPRLGYA